MTTTAEAIAGIRKLARQPAANQLEATYQRQIIYLADAVERLTADAKRNSELGKAELAMLREQYNATKTQRDELAILEADAELDLIAAEAQRDEAVRLLRLAHSELKYAEKQGHEPLYVAADDVGSFLASLSTVTEPCERVSVCCGRSVAEYNLAYQGGPHCSSCDVRLSLKCSRHGCPWPVAGECPASKEKA